MRSLLARSLAFEWTEVHLVSDDPGQGLGACLQRRAAVVTAEARDAKAESRHEAGIALLRARIRRRGVLRSMAKSGVEIAVLTNSLEATDVAAVHAGYAKRRKPLLKAGVKLFEMKRTATIESVRHPDTSSGSGGSSASSLHAKTFSIDGSRIFIGSFNFDPRSARLNTEMGFVIDSPPLAQSIAGTFAQRMPASAYEVRLAPDGTLRWIEHDGSKEIVYDNEPGTTFWKRLGVSLMSMLPIEWLL